MSIRVVAVEDSETSGPLTAILIRESHGRREVIQWWGGYAWETLEEAVPLETALDDPRYRHVDLDLPKDWEEGYLVLAEGQPQFRYGTPPEWPRPRDSYAQRLVSVASFAGLGLPLLAFLAALFWREWGTWARIVFIAVVGVDIVIVVGCIAVLRRYVLKRQT